MHGWAADVIGAVGTPQTSPAEYLSVFFAASAASQQAGKEALGRMYARTSGRDETTDWATREAQYDAVCAWGIPDHAALERVSAIDIPVFVANGDSDPMILPRYSYLLAGLIPQARLKIYPDAAHGFLFQHHADFAADVTEFLDALDRVADGGSALDPEVVAQLLARSRHPLGELTPREREVLALMAEGRSNAAIADALVVGGGAVEKHINNIFTKLGLAPGDRDHRRVLAVLRYLGT